MLIRLRGCAGWSALLLVAYGIRHVFTWPGPFDLECYINACEPRYIATSKSLHINAVVTTKICFILVHEELNCFLRFGTILSITCCVNAMHVDMSISQLVVLKDVRRFATVWEDRVRGDLLRQWRNRGRGDLLWQWRNRVRGDLLRQWRNRVRGDLLRQWRNRVRGDLQRQWRNRVRGDLLRQWRNRVRGDLLRQWRNHVRGDLLRHWRTVSGAIRYSNEETVSG